MRTSLSYKQRFWGCMLLSVLLVLVGWAVGIWPWQSSGRALWLPTAVAYLLFAYLGSPYFVAPRDSFANSVSGMLAVAAIDLGRVPGAVYPGLRSFQIVTLFVLGATVLAAGYAMARHEPQGEEDPRARIAFRFSSALGRGEVAFTPTVLLSVLGFYSGEPSQAYLLLLWAVLVFVRPIDFMFGMFELLRTTRSSEFVGIIQRMDDPNIIRVRLQDSSHWSPEHVHSACLVDGRSVEIVPLYNQIQDSEIIGTGYCSPPRSLVLPDARGGDVFLPSNHRPGNEVIGELAGCDIGRDLVGFIVENSSISEIHFELVPMKANGSDVFRSVEEGNMVVVPQRSGGLVYYQVSEALTNEEVFDKNPRGRHIVRATQLGTLDEKGFHRHGWLPAMNDLVFRCTDNLGDQENSGDFFELGHIPGTIIPVSCDFDLMASLHTAILGVTGTGKTELAFDVIREAVDRGYKVICVDFTNEYFPRLGDLQPKDIGFGEDFVTELEQKLFNLEAGEFSGSDERKALRKFIEEHKPRLNQDIKTFWGDKDWKLAIFSLKDIANTKATLWATELFLSSAFAMAKSRRGDEKLLLVLEEAHTIVPEGSFFSRSSRAETDACVGRVCQLALQGRKYGVGLLVITQRTALVSKSVLSQCNTVVSFAVHDQTSLNYLASVFNTRQVEAIPNLKFLQGIAFGASVQSDQPVVFQRDFSEEKKKASEGLDFSPVGTDLSEVDPFNAAMGGSQWTAETADDDGIPF